jgi:hypothetical protein
MAECPCYAPPLSSHRMRLTSRPTVRRSLCSLIAIVALLAQTLVPHVHGRAEHAQAADGTTYACAGGDRVAWTGDRAGSSPDGHQHGASCPLCRAQTDARSLLVPAASAVPVPIDAMSPCARDRASALRSAIRSLGAPRAPPTVS